MRNKKALVTEVMYLIIGGLCLIILVGLAVRFITFTNKSEEKQAEASLERIKGYIKAVEAEKGSKTFFIESPNGWAIVAWPHEDDKEGRMPQRCYQFGYKNYCLCICKKPVLDILATIENYRKNCQESSICIPVDMKVVTENDESKKIPLVIKGMTSFLIKFESNKIENKIKIIKLKPIG